MTTSIKIIQVKDYLKDNPKPKQEDVWDSISNSWTKYRQGKIPIVEEFLKDKYGKVIDLGCGSGRNMIKNENIEYSEIDISSKQLKNAQAYSKENNINAKFFKLSADKIGKENFKNEIFDYGLFIATLHCIEGRKERENALNEFYRVLKNGSEALISVWDSEDKRFNGLRGDIYMSWKEEGTVHMRYYYLYDKKELINLIETVGFEVLEEYIPREKDRFSRKNWIIRVRK